MQDVDPGTDTSGLENEIEKDIEDFKKIYPTEKGLEFAKTLKETYFNRFNADDDTPGVENGYMEDARNGMLDNNQLLKDNRLTGKTKAKILNSANSYDIGDKHWTDHNLYKDGLNIINGLESTSASGSALFFSGDNKNKEKSDKLTFLYRKTFEDIIDTKGIGMGRTGNRVNPLDVADTIKRLDQEGKLVITEADYKRATSGKDQATGNPKLTQFNNIKKLKNNIELKLAKETNDTKIKEYQTQIETYKQQMKEIEDSIPGGIQDIENKAFKMDKSQVYYVTDNGSVEILSSRVIYNLLYKNTYNIITDTRAAEYQKMFEITGSN